MSSFWDKHDKSSPEYYLGKTLYEASCEKIKVWYVDHVSDSGKVGDWWLSLVEEGEEIPSAIVRLRYVANSYFETRTEALRVLLDNLISRREKTIENYCAMSGSYERQIREYDAKIEHMEEELKREVSDAPPGISS
jgi:hypothetical protein